MNIFLRGLKRLPDHRRDIIIRDPKYRTISAIANELTNLEQVDAVKYAGQAIRQQVMKERSAASAHNAVLSTPSKGIKCFNCGELGLIHFLSIPVYEPNTQHTERLLGQTKESTIERRNENVKGSASG